MGGSLSVAVSSPFDSAARRCAVVLAGPCVVGVSVEGAGIGHRDLGTPLASSSPSFIHVPFHVCIYVVVSAVPSSRYSLSRGNGVSSLSRAGELDGRSTLTPYPVATHFELRRALAATLSDTLFAYDFLELFQVRC